MHELMNHTAIDRRSALCAGLAAAGAAAIAPSFPALADEAPAAPKYVFLFIGDGMGAEQVQVASYFKGALDNDGAVVSSPLSFMEFPHVGSVTTYDSTSFCPDSASTATSIAAGRKTRSGTINMDPETLSEPFQTITEKLHAQLGYKVGVVSTVNLNHATPAAFYAHQDSRKNYYAIGEEMAASGFEYFAGGAWLAPTDKEGDKTHLNDLAAEAGYTVATTQQQAEMLGASSGKVLVIAETLADGDSMSYELDAATGEWRFADYVRKGVECLGDAQPFFMMAEAGKIDWACHANDAAASIHDVLALDDAVKVALDFYAEHPDDTLVLVTADHETGGLSIGYKTTNYDTFLPNLARQTMSYVKFDTQVAAEYAQAGTTFEEAMLDVKECFGLMMPEDPDAADQVAGKDGSLLLSDYEVEQLREAFERTMSEGACSQADMSQRDYELYGTYQPFSMAVCHILDAKSGLTHGTYAHTGAPVNIYALGCGSELFDGAYDNTQIYAKLAELTGVE